MISYDYTGYVLTIDEEENFLLVQLRRGELLDVNIIYAESVEEAREKAVKMIGIPTINVEYVEEFEIENEFEDDDDCFDSDRIREEYYENVEEDYAPLNEEEIRGCEELIEHFNK